LKLAEKNDANLEEGAKLEKYIAATSPDVSNVYSLTSPDIKGIGGPVYVQVGEKVALQQISHGSQRREETGRLKLPTQTAPTWSSISIDNHLLPRLSLLVDLHLEVQCWLLQVPGSTASHNMVSTPSAR